MSVAQGLGNRKRPILFFDGVCNLCNRTIQFVLSNERSDELLFSPLQSELGQKATQQLPHGIDSLVLLENEKLYIQSDAALQVAAYLKFPYSLLKYLQIIPRFVRDPIYRLIAGNRYRLFGKRSTCMSPTPSLARRFI